MTYLLLTALCFIAAVTVNSVSVYAQKDNKTYDKFRHGLLIHTLVITPFWAFFIAMVGGLNQAVNIVIPSIPGIGLVLIIVAASMLGLSIKEVGAQALVNGNFFSKKTTVHSKSGIYKFLRDPIYDGYFVMFIGYGLFYANAAFFVLATLSFLGLNVIESHIEKIA